MNAEPLEHTWTVLAAELRAAVGDSLFDVWLAPVTVGAYDGARLVLQAPAEAQVFAWPRRMSGQGEAHDIWGSDGAPTVVELQALANPPLSSAPQRQHA